MKKPLSIVDSAVLIAAVSAISYVLGHVARIGMAQQVGVPVSLLPTVSRETVHLICGVYVVLLVVIGLLRRRRENRYGKTGIQPQSGGFISLLAFSSV